MGADWGVVFEVLLHVAFTCGGWGVGLSFVFKGSGWMSLNKQYSFKQGIPDVLTYCM